MLLLEVKSPSSPTKTRPTAKLCELSKILERLLHDQLSKCLERNNLFDPYQAGLRKGHSNQSILINLLDEFRHSIDRRTVVILVLFDLSKASDTIPHYFPLSTSQEASIL